MKRIITFFLATTLAVLTSKADEGMWLPSLISQRIADMQEKGFRLSAEDIYSINEASLKDAVVLFGRGCTGELISPEGLLLTNHHCGYSQIQKHSSVEHDYLKDGVWAMSRSEELPNEGLSVSFLDRMEDVTEIILKGCTDEMTEEERRETVRKACEELIEKVTDDKKGLRATVEALYYGNQYFLFVYREFKDIRLVGAPPSSIGKFGGDTDNWMWPRHTGDFSIFRIYADKENNPAEYSENNVPYIPKKFFKISLDGVNEGDFTFIYGFPGRTQEYIHSEGVRYIEEVSDPHKIHLRTIRLDIQKKYMSQSQAVRIMYSSKNANVANAWKKWQGEVKGLKKMNTVEVKRQLEKDFDAWAADKEYKGLVSKIDGIYKELEPYAFATDYFNETIRAVELSTFAMSVARLYQKGFDEGELSKMAQTFYKDYHLPIDKESFIALMKEYGRNMPERFQPDYYKKMMADHGSEEAWAEALFVNSLFADKEKVKALTAEDKETVINDPATEFYNEFVKIHAAEVLPQSRRLNNELQLAYRDYMRGLMEFQKDRAFYPDANLTLRVAYGQVKGYSPSDGIYFTPYSTLRGIIEKDNPDIFDYNIPQTLRDIWKNKDYGKWAGKDGEIPVCFIATNHTSGGNSGSPVINADGNLIGINFDRVWEGTMSDIVFDPEVCRNIALDIRYVLFTIDRIGNAGHLIDEMVFAE